MRLATAANQGRNFAETIERTTRALGWAPLRWQLYFLRALGEVGARLPVNDAADDFRRARFLEPNVYEVPFQEGNVWVGANQPALALTAWREALRRAGPQRADVYRAMLTVASRSSPRVHQGLEELGIIHHDLALIFLETSGGAPFMAAVRRFLDHDPTLETMTAQEKVTFFKYWAERGDAAELARAVETHPDWMSHAWSAMAKYHASRNDFRSAFELVRRFGETPPLPEAATAACTAGSSTIIGWGSWRVSTLDSTCVSSGQNSAVRARNAAPAPIAIKFDPLADAERRSSSHRRSIDASIDAVFRL